MARKKKSDNEQDRGAEAQDVTPPETDTSTEEVTEVPETIDGEQDWSIEAQDATPPELDPEPSTEEAIEAPKATEAPEATDAAEVGDIDVDVKETPKTSVKDEGSDASAEKVEAKPADENKSLVVGATKIKSVEEIKRDRAARSGAPHYETRYLEEDPDNDGVPNCVRVELVEYFNGLISPVAYLNVPFEDKTRDRKTGISGFTEVELVEVLLRRISAKATTPGASEKLAVVAEKLVDIKKALSNL